MRVAAERALRHAPILEAPHSIWEAFAARFPIRRPTTSWRQSPMWR